MNTKVALLVVTIVSWGVWGFINKIVLARMHPLQMFIVGCCMSFLTLPVYAILAKNSGINNPVSIWTILLAGTASLLSSAGNIAYIYGIRSGELGRVAVLSSAYPVLTVILAVIFFGEGLSISKIIGIILVMSGVIVLGH